MVAASVQPRTGPVILRVPGFGVDLSVNYYRGGNLAAGQGGGILPPCSNTAGRRLS
ncbi:MAG: hypothetical protein LBP22_05790 [Deltaproteobacteria bacterium]|nr:hypothetical protein [Deltaproteobacteria bacterium]